MMKIVADLHVHTVASGHAYSTVQEIARAAADRGLQMVAITDYGPAMPGSPHRYHFSNMRILPREIYGVEVLRGIEANILDVEGNIDLPDHHQSTWISSWRDFTRIVLSPAASRTTRAMVNAITGGKVDVIVHPGNPALKIQPEPVVRAAIEHNVLLEINNASLGLVRQGSRENCLELSKLTARLGGRSSWAAMPIMPDWWATWLPQLLWLPRRA